MSKCPISYKEISDGLYAPDGLKKIDPRLKSLLPLDYTAEELLREAAARSGKISLEGVQPKVSAILSVRESKFMLTDSNGMYIIKPQQAMYPKLPENEDLTMRLAESVGIETPIHGLLYDKAGSLHYFIKRFDRAKRNVKYAVEDFAQLSGKNRHTKYDSSMEKAAAIINDFCTFPVIEKVKLLRLTLFNFLVGNEDMHLKNYSLITKNNVTTLSPAYDLLNTTIAVKNAKEEIALPLKGKKSKLTRKELLDYWGRERLELNQKTIDLVVKEISEAVPRWPDTIANSFLSEELKAKYVSLLQSRLSVLNLFSE